MISSTEGRQDSNTQRLENALCALQMIRYHPLWAPSEPSSVHSLSTNNTVKILARSRLTRIQVVLKTHADVAL